MSLSALWMLLLKIFIVLFMAGNLLELGLKLDPRDALRGLRDIRFVAYTLIWGFVLIPALAFAVTLMIPLDPDLSAGLILIGMAPCAPILPMIVGRVKGDLGYTAAFMIITLVGTVFFMPFAIPFMVEGFSVSAWMIAKPLILVILIPLVLGALIRQRSSRIAALLQPWVKKITGLSTFGVIIFAGIVYGKDVITVFGSLAITAQLLFMLLTALFTYVLGFGLKYDQRIVLSAGMTTRNIGASLAPLLAVSQVNQRATVMVVLGLPLMIIVSVVAALMFYWAQRFSETDRISRNEGSIQRD